MLGKLLKHEFRASGRIMLPVMGILLLLTVLANLSIRFAENFRTGFVQALFGLIIAAFFLMIFAAMIIALVLMINRFYRNFLKDEGYLMHTLPVSVHGLVWSKVIVSFAILIITGIVVVCVMMFTVFNLAGIAAADIANGLMPLNEFIAEIAETTGLTKGNIWLFAIEILFLFAVSGVSSCLMIYASMAIGHSASNKKVMYSIIAFVAISFIFQMLMLAFGFITSDIGSGISYVVNNGQVMGPTAQEVFSEIQKLMLASLGYSTVQAAILYVATTWSLKNRLNLE